MTSELFEQSSLRILRPASINVLGLRLNRRKIFTTRDKKLRDYRGLAELVGLSFDEMAEVEAAENNHVKKIIVLWCRKQKTASVEDLVNALGALDRHDAIDDVRPLLVADCEAARAVGVNTVALGATYAEARNVLTLADVAASRRGEQMRPFDVFLVHETGDDDDDEFAYHLVERMEMAGLKVFLPSRDVLAGSVYHAEAVTVIKNRVKHVFIVCSDTFFEDRSGANRYLYNIIESIAMNNKEKDRFIVPIKYKKWDKSKVWTQISMIQPFDHRRSTQGRYYNFYEKMFCRFFNLQDVDTRLIKYPERDFAGNDNDVRNGENGRSVSTSSSRSEQLTIACMTLWLQLFSLLLSFFANWRIFGNVNEAY